MVRTDRRQLRPVADDSVEVEGLKILARTQTSTSADDRRTCNEDPHRTPRPGTTDPTRRTRSRPRRRHGRDVGRDRHHRYPHRNSQRTGHHGLRKPPPGGDHHLSARAWDQLSGARARRVR
ncbi:hypothetical protein [Rhodococcus koreensis]